MCEFFFLLLNHRALIDLLFQFYHELCNLQNNLEHPLLARTNLQNLPVRGRPAGSGQNRQIIGPVPYANRGPQVFAFIYAINMLDIFLI